MSYYDDFNKRWLKYRKAPLLGQGLSGLSGLSGLQATPYKAPTFGAVTSDPAAGQTGSNDLQQDRPDTMQGWQSKIGGMSRLEKDQQYPGMHTDLIPAYEMITGGDPNWGMEGQTENLKKKNALGTLAPKVVNTYQNRQGATGPQVSYARRSSVKMAAKQDQTNTQLEELREELRLLAKAIDAIGYSIRNAEAKLAGLTIELNLTGITQARRAEVKARIYEQKLAVEQLESEKELLLGQYTSVRDQIERLESGEQPESGSGAGEEEDADWWV